MAEPTLSDITSIRGDASIAGGTAGVGDGVGSPAPVEFDKGLQFLNEAAQARAGYNKYLTEQYQNNLTSSLNNLRSIDLSKAMSSDLPALRQQFAQLAKNVADNPGVIQNPGSNPEIDSQLKQQEAELRGAIAQSESHNAINDYNKKFLAANPTFNTKENQDKIAGFQNAPLDQRKDFLLTTPNNFDVNKLAQTAGAYATNQVSKQALSKDKNWILTQEGTEFAKDQYHKATLALLHNTVENGEPLYDKYMQDYNLLPADLKKNTSPDDYILGVVDSLAPTTSLKTSMKDNPFALQNDKQAFEASESAKQRTFEADQNAKNRDIQNKLLKKGEIDPQQAGEAKLRTLANTFTSGNMSDDLGQKVYGDNSKIIKSVRVFSPDGSTESSKIPVPLVQFTGSSIDPQGNLHIHRKDNSTNQDLPDIIRSYDQAYSDFDKLYGDTYAPQIGSATAAYSQKNFKKPTPTIEDLRQHFNVPNVVVNQFKPKDIPTPVGIIPNAISNPQDFTQPTTPAASGTLSDDAYNDFLKKNGLK